MYQTGVHYKVRIPHARGRRGFNRLGMYAFSHHGRSHLFLCLPSHTFFSASGGWMAMSVARLDMSERGKLTWLGQSKTDVSDMKTLSWLQGQRPQRL
jgi:hypothetical protein